MKLIIAGGRDFLNTHIMEGVLGILQDNNLIPDRPELVCGMARGADMTAHMIFKHYGLPIHEFKPDWNIGRHAGFLRNEQMGRFADAAVIFWDGESRGTKHMISFMRTLRKPMWVYDYEGRPRSNHP